MQETTLTEWLNRPETRTLVVLLRKTKAATVQGFLAGQPVDPVMQGRAAALHDLEVLLASGADKVKSVFEQALKGDK